MAMSTLKKSKFRNNQEIELKLNRTIEECPNCTKILKDYYNSVLDDI